MSLLIPQVKEVKELKKAWAKPTIVSYEEDELLVKMSVKSQTFVDEGFTDGGHTDTDSHSDDYTDSNGPPPGP